MYFFIKNRIWQNEKYRFLIIGAYNTGFGYFCFIVLYHLYGHQLHYLVIAVLSHLIAVANAFTSQRVLVFRASGSIVWEFVRFNITSLGTLAFGMAGVVFLVEQAKLSVVVSQTLITGLNVIISYFAHKHFTFKPSRLLSSTALPHNDHHPTVRYQRWKRMLLAFLLLVLLQFLCLFTDSLACYLPKSLAPFAKGGDRM